MMQVQQRFHKNITLKKPYSYGPYDKVRGKQQAIRITEGCPWNCANCYEPTEFKIFGIPELKRNDVLIYDMNLLCKPEALQIIEDLGKIRVNSKVVKYQLVCGIDYQIPFSLWGLVFKVVKVKRNDKKLNPMAACSNTNFK